MFGIFSIETVNIDAAGEWLWSGVFFRDRHLLETLYSAESCSLLVEQTGKNSEIYGVFEEIDYDVVFFDSEYFINEIVGKRGKIQLIKGHEWTQGSVGTWTSDDKKHGVYITM